ncbi:hypothetical protein KSP39_PZI003617 [Platanthera zijinensis]|uniref:Uncharacterized protein n=1 Tax=Platanthera zijinensis TaxID=2320716 RepID=A0AAP0BWY8_9ASPA
MLKNFPLCKHVVSASGPSPGSIQANPVSAVNSCNYMYTQCTQYDFKLSFPYTIGFCDAQYSVHITIHREPHCWWNFIGPAQCQGPIPKKFRCYWAYTLPSWELL